MIDFGMDPQMAGDAARIRHGGSATPTGLPKSRRWDGLPGERISSRGPREAAVSGHRLGVATDRTEGIRGF